jgi:cell shape-determining protein MreC
MPTHWLTHKRLMMAVIAALLVCSMLPGRTVGAIARVPTVIVDTLTYPPIALISMATPNLRPAETESVTEGGSRAQLQRELDQLLALEKNLRARLNDLKQKYDSLKAVQERLPEGLSVTPVEARVGGLSGGSTSPVLMIGRGRKNGIRAGQVAVHRGNLVGEVVHAGPVTARVKLIVAAETSLGVRIAPPQKPGEDTPASPREVSLRLTWNADEGVFVASLDKHKTIEVGDIARLDDEAWPLAGQGYTVGKVTEVQNPHPRKPVLQRIRVKPLAPLKQLDRIAVHVPSAQASEAR